MQAAFPTPSFIHSPRFYGNRACPGVSLSADITQGWGPEVMLLNSPPPGVYRYKVHQYSAAGSLRHVHLPHLHPVSPHVCLSESGAIVSFYGATPEPLVFRPASHGTIEGGPAAHAHCPPSLDRGLTSYNQVASGTSSRSQLRQTAR